MRPGNHSVTFVLDGNTVSRDKQGIAVKSTTSTVVTGCFMQPLSLHDQIGDTNMSQSTHKCIAPSHSTDLSANDAVLACKAEDELVFNGFSYRVMGVKAYDTWDGVNDHVTVICQRQDG